MSAGVQKPKRRQFWARLLMSMGFRLSLALCAVGSCALDISSIDSGPRLVSSVPAMDEAAASRQGPFTASFDRDLDPRTVSAGSVSIRTGTTSVRLSVRYDPIDRRIIAVPLFDMPLLPDVGYRMTIDGVADLAGNRLAEPAELVFRTGTALTDPSVPIPPAFEHVLSIFISHCADASCHGSTDPVLGLDLSSPEGIRATAVGVPAEQVRRIGQTLEGARRGPGLLGFPRVDVAAGLGRPQSSYLLYKMLAVPAVSGSAMPPPPRNQLSEAEIRQVSEWILAGAVLQ